MGIKEIVSNSPLKIGLAKLSTNMSNACGGHMRYKQNVNKSTLQSLLVLNPECQIKILEENLKFLFKENSTYNYFQIKSNHLSLRSGSTDTVASTNNDIGPKALLMNSTEPSFHHQSKTEIHVEKNESVDLETFSDKSSDRKELFSVNNSEIPLNMLKDTTRVKNKRVICAAAQSRPLKSFFDENDFEVDNGMKDADNHYEFTVEQEKIVSFVCSTSPPRNKTDKSSSGTEFSDDQTVFSDHDSDSHSKLWAACNGESDSLSESASNTCCASDKINKFDNTDYLSKLQQMTGSSKLLWHPPTTSLSCNYSLDTPKGKQVSCPTSLANCKTTESVSDIMISSDSVQRKMANSFSRETTLFRETSLRGCYNMESIVKCVIPSQIHVQQELKRVKESIFSSVRLEQNSDDLVSDSILSILDICKSWLKLSSHLKGKAFMDILESKGTNPSILNDFLQWQCVSRVFIDKMIDTLQNIAPNVYSYNVSNTLNDLSSLTHTDVKNLVYSPGISNAHNCAPSTNTCQSEHDFASAKCELNPNKNWKQRRFFLDHPKQVVMESKNACGPNCSSSNIYNNHSQTHSPCSSDMLYGQGDPTLAYNSQSNSCKINHPFPVKNTFSRLGDVSFPLNNYSVFHGNVTNSYHPDKHTNLPCISKTLKHNERERGGTKSFQSPITSNLTKEFPTLSLPMNPHSQSTVTNFAIVPPFYDSQMCYTNTSNYQLNNGPYTIKPNPIQCIDSDIVEKCTKSSYMKPGSYNVPEKPIGFQKIINNNIPIDDSPVVGVPFLFPGGQGNVVSPKNHLPSINATGKQGSIEDDGVKKSEEKWKAAMTSAETFRDNLVLCKSDSGPNLKLSDTVSLKTHFLLLDEFSQGSSSNDFKLSGESEEMSACEQGSPAVDVSIVEAKVKTSDWLMQSFNKAVLENENEIPNYINCTKLNIDSDSEFEIKDIYRNKFTSGKLVTNKNEGSNNNNYDSSCNLSNSHIYFQYGVNENVNSKPESSVINQVDRKSEINDITFTGKKTNRNCKKLQDNTTISSLFDHKSSLFNRKAKSIFKRAITKPISSKLEDILNCICSTEVSNLVEFDSKSEKEVSRLEIKVRCPLYLQAMRCKLANHSYDTLDQALYDFQKYFMDIRNRNKGDKQSTDVVGALEHLFLDLVEKHFGSCRISPQYFGLGDLSSPIKPRKSKKISRRC